MTDSPTVTLTSLAKATWWLVLLRGVIAIIFGVIALIAPMAALTAIAIVFGAYALVDGIATVVQGIGGRGSDPYWGWLVAGGVVTALAGLAALVLPLLVGAIGGLVVLWTIVIWSIVAGVLGLRSALGATGGSRIWGVLVSLLSIVLGVVLAIAVITSPQSTLLGLIWLVGIYELIYGIVLIVVAVRARLAKGKTATA